MAVIASNTPQVAVVAARHIDSIFSGDNHTEDTNALQGSIPKRKKKHNSRGPNLIDLLALSVVAKSGTVSCLQSLSWSGHRFF